jgi:NADPH:quinone reductase-like Zn-dependent oxidoreductase
METNWYPIDFSGKTALVTGSTKGLGRAFADLLSDLGAKVIYTGTKHFFDLAERETMEYWQMEGANRITWKKSRPAPLIFPSSIFWLTK